MYNENLFIIYMRQIPSFGKKCRTRTVLYSTRTVLYSTRTGFCNFNEYINVKEDKISTNSMFRIRLNILCSESD